MVEPLSQATIDKLKKNPHYKRSEDIVYHQPTESPVREFGVLPIHETALPIHPTEKKRGRKNKKKIDV